MGIDKELGIVHGQYKNHEYPNARAVVAIERLLDRKEALRPSNVKAMAKTLANAMRLGMRTPREVDLGRNVRVLAHDVAACVAHPLRAHFFGDTGDIMRFVYVAQVAMPDAHSARSDYLRAYHAVAHLDPEYAITIACNMTDLGRHVVTHTHDPWLELEALGLLERSLPRVTHPGALSRAQRIQAALRHKYPMDTTNF